MSETKTQTEAEPLRKWAEYLRGSRQLSSASANELIHLLDEAANELERLEDELTHAKEARGNAEVAYENEHRWVERLLAEHAGGTHDD